MHSFRFFTIKSPLQDIVKEPDRSFLASNDLGALYLNELCCSVYMDCDFTKQIRVSIREVEEESSINKEIPVVKGVSGVCAINLDKSLLQDIVKEPNRAGLAT